MADLDRLDAIAVHAAAAAAVIDAKFYDVAVGFTAAKGRCVRIFYGGERVVEHFSSDRVLGAKLIGQAVIVRAYWPLSETATKRQRVQEGEMITFVRELRTRILGDSQLGGLTTDLNMDLARAEQVVIASTKYSIVDVELVLEFDEYPLAP